MSCFLVISIMVRVLQTSECSWRLILAISEVGGTSFVTDCDSLFESRRASNLFVFYIRELSFHFRELSCSTFGNFRSSFENLSLLARLVNRAVIPAQLYRIVSQHLQPRWLMPTSCEWHWPCSCLWTLRCSTLENLSLLASLVNCAVISIGDPCTTKSFRNTQLLFLA